MLNNNPSSIVGAARNENDQKFAPSFLCFWAILLRYSAIAGGLRSHVEWCDALASQRAGEFSREFLHDCAEANAPPSLANAAQTLLAQHGCLVAPIRGPALCKAAQR